MVTRLRGSSDDGFSVAELVFAAAIMFFVLTAMLGLVGASQKMTASAKRRTVVTNATAEYIDRLRAVEFAKLAIEPVGTVKASEDVVYEGVTIHFTNRVAFQDSAGQKLRTVYVNASCVIAGATYENSAVVHIKNPNDDTSASELVDPDLPVIKIVSPTPPENSVLYGKWVHPTYTNARIVADVSSPRDAITEVRYKVGNVLLRDGAGASGDDALFTFTPGLASVTTDSDWDTTQEGVTDGFQTVLVIARDDQLRTKSEQRTFIVDNAVPGVPGAPVGQSTTSTQGKLQFGAAPDPVPSGGNPPASYATRYMYNLYKEPATIVGSTSSWSLVATATVSAGTSIVNGMHNEGPLAASVATQPFSRYWATVRAGSPRDFNWAQSASMTTPFISRPEVRSAGSELSQCVTNFTRQGKNPQTDYTVTLYVTRPTFPINSSPGATVFTYYQKQAVVGSQWSHFTPISSSVTEVGNYFKLVFTFRQSAEAKNLWFKVGVQVTPTGSAGGTLTDHVFSNAAGTSPIDTDRYSHTSVTGTLIPDATWSE